MTDYSQLSDFEINAAVFEALHGGSPDFKEGENGAMVLLSFEGDIVDGNVVEVEVERGVFNPCNNPADAWPIILKNGINVFTDMIPHGLLGQARASVISHEPSSYECIIAKDANPLRAAMIVFLMMQDSSNANPI